MAEGLFHSYYEFINSDQSIAPLSPSPHSSRSVSLSSSSSTLVQEPPPLALTIGFSSLLFFNCRGWNNGLLSLRGLINSFDLCFIQEHWLHHDHLHKINNVSSYFLSVNISRMESGVLLQGQPCGGCSILYRKSLSSFVSPLRSCSNRFCGVLFVDSNGVSYLLVCVYMLLMVRFCLL